jgi:glycerophosphoryl diester phosphodiesterase/dienelactone hydrolase
MTHLFVLCLAAAGQMGIPAGAGKIEIVVGPAQTEIEVFTYKPAEYRDGPLILVFHGVLRNADEYRDHARQLGDRLGAVIAAPRFDNERFPIESYQRGGVLKQGQPVPRDEWTFSLVPGIAAEILKREGRSETPYYLLGHSGGAQFLARLAGFVDSGAARIVAANPGTYLMPTRDKPYPYGFGGLPAELSDDAALRRYLAQPLTLYLGTHDTEADQYLDKSPEAQAQGAVRLTRGRNTFQFAEKLAHERGWAFHWRLVEAPGVEHDHDKMFNHPRCAAALFGLNPVHVVGHRGLLKQAPENTLANFRACLELRLGFEFDVRRTTDGHLVCLHDATLDRTTEGTGNVADQTLDQVRELDAGRWFAPEFSGERVPTIDEVFSLLAQHRDRSVLAAVDIKAAEPQVEADLIRLAKQHQVLDRLVFIGRTIDDAAVRRRLKGSDSQARTARLAAQASDIGAILADPDCDWVYLRFIPAVKDVRRIQESGRRIFMAGPLVAGREPAQWRAAAVAGIDAILTDHPLELRQELVAP